MRLDTHGLGYSTPFLLLLPPLLLLILLLLSCSI